MGITDKIAPAAGNIKDSVQAAMQPYAGSLVNDDSTEPPVTSSDFKSDTAPNGGWLTGPALQGKSVQLHCRDACLPLCSSIQSMNPNNTLPCWADANNNVIFGKPVGTLGTASVLALFLVIASLLGFIAGRRVDMNRVRERVDLDKMKQKLPSVNVEKLKQNGPDVKKLKDNAIGTFGKVKDTTYGAFGQAKDSAYGTFGQMKDSAAGTFGKAKENMTGDGLNQNAEALSGRVRPAGSTAEAEMNKEIRKMEDLKDDTYGQPQ